MTRLSIYIPTSNRPDYFHRLLGTLEPELRDGVEVVASLNPPCEGYQFPDWVTVRRNRIDVNGRTNFLLGPLVCTGDYIWMLGDDEQVLPGAIDTILAGLVDNPGILFMTDGHKPLGVPLGSRWPTYPAMLQAALNNNFPYTATIVTLASATVFLREAFDLALAVLKTDTLYGQHYGMLSKLMHGPVAVATQGTFRSGHSQEASIYMYSQDIVVEHIRSYPKVLFNLVEWINEQGGIDLPVWDTWDPNRGFDC